MLLMQTFFCFNQSSTRWDKVSGKYGCFLLAPLCLVYVYHGIDKNGLHPLHAQPPTELHTARPSSLHRQLGVLLSTSASSAINAKLFLTGKLKICSWQAHPELHRIYFEVNNTACLEGPDSQAGIHVLPPGPKYRIIASFVCVCCTDTLVEKRIKPWHLFLKEKFSEKKNVSQQARLQCSVLPQGSKKHPLKFCPTSLSLFKDYDGAGKGKERSLVIAFSGDCILYKPLHTTAL